MSKTIWLPPMSDIQIRKNVAYLVDCMNRPIDPQNDIGATIYSWRDVLLGRTFAPGDNEVWSDVVQPKAVEACTSQMNGIDCGILLENHPLWEKEHEGQPFVHIFQ